VSFTGLAHEPGVTMTVITRGDALVGCRLEAAAGRAQAALAASEEVLR
jgi:hypothetical protein